MSGLTFAHPLAMVISVLILPAVALLWYFNFKMRVRGNNRYGDARLLAGVSRSVSLKDEVRVFAVWAMSVFLVVIAAADPALPAAPAVVSSGSMQVVVVIDVSNSMAQEYYRRDMSVPESGIPAGSFGTCLDMAKQLTVDEIMPAIRGNEIGVVGYAGRGFPQAELTHDLESVSWVLRHWMKVKDVPGVGSDYAAGLRQAVSIFDRSENGGRQRVIVLFSDGGFTGNENDLAEVLQLLKDHGIRLVVVAVGSPVPMAIPMYDNQNRYIGDFPGNGNVELVKTDETKLRSLAAQADGIYIRLLARQRLNIDWASALASDRAVTEFAHIYQIPLSMAALLFAALLLRGLRSSRRPSSR